MRFTPHARGSTSGEKPDSLSTPVYPACAGIDLYRIRLDPGTGSLPRMRGDRPISVVVSIATLAFTACAGSTKGAAFPETLEFTPHAGSTLIATHPRSIFSVYPHARGSTPRKIIYLTPSKFTPHAGSTDDSVLFTNCFGVYPACEDRPPSEGQQQLRSVYPHA